VKSRKSSVFGEAHDTWCCGGSPCNPESDMPDLGVLVPKRCPRF
jgi:hypothetical protein